MDIEQKKHSQSELERQQLEDLIFRLQEEGKSLNEIAEIVGKTPSAVKSFMSRRHCIRIEGLFVKKDTKFNTNEQLTLTPNIATEMKSSAKRAEVKNKEQEECNPNTNLVFVAKTTKKPGKLEMTPEFLDMICELRDWHKEVKDLPQLKHKVTKKNKNVNLDEMTIIEPVRKMIQMDKTLLDNFETLSINSGEDVSDLIIQAMINFLKEYKHLI